MLTFSELKRLESKTITAIRTLGVFGRLDSLATAAKQTNNISTASREPIDLHLSFTLPTRLREDAGREAIHRSFDVGCCAVSNGKAGGISQLSYSVMIGEEAAPSKRVARKFHFDFEPVISRDTGESKPTFHLQMCGELNPHHEAAGYTEENIAHLLPAWSQPRIPAQPMSLALVLNWLLIEFGRETAVRNARLDPTWRSLVRQAERTILMPYYEDCHTFLSTAANDDESFMAKQIYEED